MSRPRDGSTRAIDAIAAVDGFAVGRGLRFARGSGPVAALGATPGVAVREAVTNVRSDLERLIGTLPHAQAKLFEPELNILGELESRLLAREEEGQPPDEAVVAETSCGCTDLVVDLRVRLLHALESSHGTDLHALAARHETDLVLLTDLLTPTLVASLPRQIVAVVASLDGSADGRRDVGANSHAAILARGRGLPVVYVAPEQLASIPDGTWVIVAGRAGSASVRVDPDERRLETARRWLQRSDRRRLADAVSSVALARLGIEVRVNVASPEDPVPEWADGVGLVRTEMMFAGRLTAPSESEQLAALLLIAAKARGRPVVVRLFDAGADKPLVWLGGARDPSRGIRRLLAYPEVFATQLRALARAREHADVRVLLPFVETPDDVNVVREQAPPSLRVGAMIESPGAVEAAESIASVADFISIGSNDLTATTLGVERTASVPRVHPKVIALVRRVIGAAHARGRRTTICGEMAGDERGARIAVGLGTDVLSVAPARLAAVRKALGRTTAQSCRAEARTASHGPSR